LIPVVLVAGFWLLVKEAKGWVFTWLDQAKSLVVFSDGTVVSTGWMSGEGGEVLVGRGRRVVAGDAGWGRWRR
jgi:hypothetical protein